MIKLKAKRTPASMLDTHYHVCDFINVEAAVLCLYSDGKRNWIYLWCDTDNIDTDRWMIFSATRQGLLGYLEGKKPLLELIYATPNHFILDRVKLEKEEVADDGGSSKVRRFVSKLEDLNHIESYLPGNDSFFDSDLTSDIELEEQILPAVYEVPIRGTWFGADFEQLFRSYERVYALLYATKPRFVKTIGERLENLLRAPWTGGFSRVHLYSQLAKHLPALHSLKVNKLKFASPGEVEFEALESVGATVEKITLRLLEKNDEVWQAVRIMKALLTRKKLNKKDLSQHSDVDIGLLQDEIRTLQSKCMEIAGLLGIEEEIATLEEHSPNSVVFSKATSSFVKQLSKLVVFENNDMLNFRRLKGPDEEDSTDCD
jgi:hypothetical protein